MSSLIDYVLKNEDAYDDLLSMLRQDLQLDPSTDLLGGSPAGLLNLGIDRGVAGVTFTASNVSTVVAVKHRLGRVPTTVLCTLINSGSTTPIDIRTGAFTTTGFNVFCVAGAAITQPQLFAWAAML